MIKEGHSVCSDLFETSTFPLWSHDIYLHIQACFKAALRSGCTSSLWSIILPFKYFSTIPHEPFTPFIFSVKKKQKGKIPEKVFFVSEQPDETLHHGNLQSCIWRSRVNTTFPFTVRVVSVFKQFFANVRADLRTG